MDIQSQKRFWAFLPHLLLMVAAFALYVESFAHQWSMDDYPVVVLNQDIRSWTGFLQDSYPGRPLRELTYMFDYKLFGLEPAGYHFQNILWHGLNACLLVLVARALGGSSPVAWWAGTLFLVHPINVEVVANISHRKDSLMLFFVQLSLLAALRFYRTTKVNSRIQWAGLSSLYFTIACFAKQAAAGLFPLLLGYELTLAEKREKVFLRSRFLVWLGVATAFSFTIYWYLWVWQGEQFQESIVGTLVRLKVYSGWTNELYLLVIFKSLAFMFLRLVWPASLAMEYVYSVPQSWLDPWVLSGLGLLVGGGAVIFLCRHHLPLVTIGVVWLLAFWLPVSNLLWPIAYFAADRYMYASSAGLALVVAALAAKMMSGRMSFFYSAALFMTLGLAFLTWQQNRVWQDEFHLFEQALKVSPGSTRALMGLGVEYMDAGQFELAKTYLEQAAADFNDSKALHLLGQLYEKMGDQRKALRYYQRFIMMNEQRYQEDVLSLRRHLQMHYGVSP